MKKILILTLLLVAACTQLTTLPEQSSEEVAQEFMENSPTYVYDGYDLELVSTEPLECEGCAQYTYSFMARHGGYGDREGQMVTQVITPHTAVIRVEEGQVTSAIMDNRWDMKAQTLLQGVEWKGTQEQEPQEPSGMTSWQQAVQIIHSGQVDQVTQLHSREVILRLKDGSEIRTIEPNLDDVWDELEQCDQCEDVVLATE